MQHSWKVKLIIAVLIGVLLFILCCVLFGESVPEVRLETEDHAVSLENVDFSRQIALLPSDADFYRERLLTPPQFETDDLPAPESFQEIEGAYAIPYGTYRMTLTGEPNRHYLLTGYSLDYGMRLWCGTDLLLEVGTVADRAEEAVPRVGAFTVPVSTDDQGIMRLTIQYANFVHNEGGYLSTWRLGSSERITTYLNRENLLTYVLCGGFNMLAAYFLVRFFFSWQKEILLLSLCSLLIALRNQQFYLSCIVSSNYDWFLHYRLIVLYLLWIPYMILLILPMVSTAAQGKVPMILGTAATAVMTALIFLLPTRHVVIISMVYAGAIALLLLTQLLLIIVRSLWAKRFTANDRFILAGAFAVMVTGLLEIRLGRVVPFITRVGLMPFGIIIFLFLISASSDLKVRQTRIALQRQQETTEILRRESEMHHALLSSVSHEMRTPLATISGYAQLAVIQLKKQANTPAEEVLNNLTFISREAQRLASLSDQLLETNMVQSLNEKTEPLRFQDLSGDIQRIAAPLLAKKSNRLVVDIPQDLPQVMANPEMLLQVIYNLLTNANRHAKNDAMVLSAAYSEDAVSISLTDHGDGMTPEQLSRAFDRGYSPDGGTGLGLSLCREIIKALGGTMQLTSTKNVGTRALIRLPAAAGEGGKNHETSPAH